MRKIPHFRKWERCRLEKRSQHLPSRAGCYAILDRHSRLYYIGRSKDLSKRWAGGEHHRYPQALALRGAQLAWLVCDARSVEAIERHLILAYKPKWNYTAVPKARIRRHRNYSLLSSPIIQALIIGFSIIGFGLLLSPG